MLSSPVSAKCLRLRYGQEHQLGGTACCSSLLCHGTGHKDVQPQPLPQPSHPGAHAGTQVPRIKLPYLHSPCPALISLPSPLCVNSTMQVHWVGGEARNANCDGCFVPTKQSCWRRCSLPAVKPSLRAAHFGGCVCAPRHGVVTPHLGQGCDLGLASARSVTPHPRGWDRRGASLRGAGWREASAR